MGPATLAVVAAVEAAVAVRPLVVGVSGGADSLALAAATVVVAGRRGLLARGLVIDHGLQDDSAEVAAKAAKRAGRLGLECDVVPVEVAPAGDGVEAAARTARREALELVAGSLDADILLGHTLDDQAESVLLGLARGSGARSLSGMPVRRGRVVRPLLGLRRATTEAACAELGTKFWADPHNADPAYARSRVRHRVLPVLEDELGPGIAEALARTADLLRDDADLLDDLAGAHTTEHELDIDALPKERALRGRVLRRWLVDQGASEPTMGHVHAVEELVTRWHGQKWVDVPGVRVARRANRLCVL
ncbi:tRNA lysidine(34) synthetase TilS [Mariniluteicoccus endophyticus]